MKSVPASGKKGLKGWIGKAMKFLIPVIVTVGLCWLMFKHIDYREMLGVIRRECNFWFIAIGLVIGILAMVLRAMRWNIQLRALGIDAPMKSLVLSIFGTYAVNLVFPRLGEVWRTGYIAQKQKAPFSAVFGSMVGDRLADTATVLLMLIAALAVASGQMIDYLSQNKEMYEKLVAVAASPWIWVAVAACIALAWWALAAHATPGSVLDRLQTFVRGLWSGFAVLATMPHKGRWLLFTAGIWLCYFSQLYLAFYAFPFTSQALSVYGISMAFVAFVLTSISMGVPSNGGIGPYQWAMIFALMPYGVGKTDAMAFGNLLLGSQTIVYVVLGLATFVSIMLDKKHNSSK